MSIIALGWFIGLHLVMAIWLGTLASVWKKRNMWRWIAIGLVTSFVGVILLARTSRLSRTSQVVEVDMQVQYLDGTSLLQ